jgi:pimeloyl-ACP methyl ester carboxylesterase
MVTDLSPEIEINFMHGWGFDSQLWQNWDLSGLGRVRQNHLERGYFGDPKLKIDTTCCTLRVLIVHSFGLHIVPKELFTNLHSLVIISGFSQFLPLYENSDKKNIALHMMRRKFLLKPYEVLADFYRRCAGNEATLAAPSFDNINLDLLSSDLLLMQTSIFDLKMLALIPGVILLHGDKDKIVDHSQSIHIHNQLPNSKLFVIAKGEHALPVLNSKECIDLIENSLTQQIEQIEKQRLYL